MRAGNVPGSKATKALLRKGAEGFSKARWISRPVKFVATGGMIHIQEFLRDAAMQDPIVRRIIGLLGLACLLTSLTLGIPERLTQRMWSFGKLTNHDH